MMFVALIAALLLFSILLAVTGKGTLFIPSNITNLISQNAYVVILATGMLLCILTGGNIDLSVGSVVAFVGAIAGQLIVSMKFNIYITILLCLVVGLAVGCWHGFWIAYIKIPPFIVTLSGMMVWRGMALVVLNGFTLNPFPDDYQAIFAGYLPIIASGDPSGKLVRMWVTLAVGILICIVFIIATLIGRSNRVRKGYKAGDTGTLIAKIVLVCAIVMIIFWFLSQDKGLPVVLIMLGVIVGAYSYFTAKTVPGRHLYALGGNAKAAQLSGVNTNRVMFFAYANMGFLSAVTALVSVGRFSAANPQMGTSYELDAIGACFIGGASAYGGTGTVGGAVVGAIFMGVLNNGLSMMHADQNIVNPIKGLVLLMAVAFDVISKRRARSM